MSSNVINLPRPDKILWCSYCQKDDHTDATCWSTRAITAAPLRYFDIEEKPGFHKVFPLLQCQDEEHSIPVMMNIPLNTRYVHYCPTCRYKSVAFGVIRSQG